MRRILGSKAAIVCLLTVFLLPAPHGHAQTAPAAAASRLTVDDVIRMAKGGVSESIILTRLRSAHQTFDLTTDQLIALKSASVSDTIIKAMLGAPVQTPATASPAKQSTPPAPAKTTAPVVIRDTAIIPKPLPAAAAVQWVKHDDPKGFSLSVPVGWTINTDRTPGRIDVEGPQYLRVVIWPAFVRDQQLDANGAARVAQKLAGSIVPADMHWKAPVTTGDSIRLYGSSQSTFGPGPESGVAMMRWIALPKGASVLMFCVSAPTPIYRSAVDTFATILKSFKVIADPNVIQAVAQSAQAAPAEPPISWVQWTDPRERAVSAEVPRGWSVSGGADRKSPTDIRLGVLLLAPDQNIRMTLGDAGIGLFTAPNRMMAMAGMRPGAYTALGDGTRVQIRAYEQAQPFINSYVASVVGRECQQPRIVSASQRPDLGAAARKKAMSSGARNPQVTSAGVSFTCNWKGREAVGYYAASTVAPLPGQSGLWYVEGLYGYLALPDQQKKADDISRHILNSMGINATWQAQENQAAAGAVQADNQRSAQIQARARAAIQQNQQDVNNMIIQGHEERQKIMDEVDRKRENAILGTVDVVDPGTGKQYKVDNYSDYHWINNEQTIAGTKTYDSPGADYHEVLTLP